MMTQTRVCIPETGQFVNFLPKRRSNLRLARTEKLQRARGTRQSVIDRCLFVSCLREKFMSTSRRHFLKSTAAAGLMAGQKISANDRLQIALIGAGGMGSGDTRYQLGFPGVAL